MHALLIYPKTPSSFWSSEGFLDFVGQKVMAPPLRLITIASILPQEWEFRLIDCNERDVTETDWDWGDIVLFSAMLVQKESLFELIKAAKQRNKTVVAGGPYATSLPEEVRTAGADFIVLDEGEITIPPLVTALERGETSGTFSALGKKPEMEKSPVPRFDLLNFDDYHLMSLQVSRGCPFQCEFCDIIELYGRRPRIKTPEQILAEFQALYDLGWRGPIFVVDDNFIGNKRYIKSILQEMAEWQKRNNFPFSLITEASVNLAHDKNLLQLMHDAGFYLVFVGIETPDFDSLILT